MAKNATDSMVNLALDAARVQLATINAGIEFWSGWLQHAAKFSQAASTELLSVEIGRTKAEDVVVRLADASQEFLRRTTELPKTAVTRFEKELANRKSRSNPRQRAAKVKE